jgi:hypothetical protein
VRQRSGQPRSVPAPLPAATTALHDLAALLHLLPFLVAPSLTFAAHQALPTNLLPHRPIYCRTAFLHRSNHNQGHQLAVVLPEGLRHLEMLSARADTVVRLDPGGRRRGRSEPVGRPAVLLHACGNETAVEAGHGYGPRDSAGHATLSRACPAPALPAAPPSHTHTHWLPQVADWPDLCARCEEAHLTAGLLVLEAGKEPFEGIARRVGYTGLQVRPEAGRAPKQTSKAMLAAHSHGWRDRCCVARRAHATNGTCLTGLSFWLTARLCTCTARRTTCTGA